MKNTELKPCPFCGKHKRIRVEHYFNGSYAGHDIYYVECGNCWSTGAKLKTERGAVAAWNRRAK